MTGFHVVARVRRVLLVVGVAFAAVPVGSALADDVTVGQTGGGVDCSVNNGFLMVDSDRQYQFRDGLLKSFSFQSSVGNMGQRIEFLTLRPGSRDGSKWFVWGTSRLVSLSGTGLEMFPATIGVADGDVLGFWLPEVVPGEVFVNCARNVGGGGGANGAVQPTAPREGDIVTVNQRPDLDLNESAVFTPTPVGSPPRTPTSKDQCKHGWWKQFGFKNQGACVSFVVHHRPEHA